VPIIVSGRGDMPVDNTSGCGGILNTDKGAMKLLEMLFGREGSDRCARFCCMWNSINWRMVHLIQISSPVCRK